MFTHKVFLIIFVCLCLASCVNTFKTPDSGGQAPAILDLTPAIATDIAELIAVNGLPTSSRWSPTAYPRRAELTPGSNTVKVRFYRLDLVPVGARTNFGENEFTFEAESGQVYTIDWSAKSQGWFKPYELTTNLRKK